MTESGTRHHDDAFMSAARAELEQDLAGLDAVTAARLRAARARALEAAEQPQRLPWWQPAGMVAAGVVIVTAVLILNPQPLPLEDDSLEFISTLDEGEDLYENLDFYEWLEAQADEEHV